MKILAVLLAVTLVAPSIFFVAPQHTAHAAAIPTFETNPYLIGQETITAVKSTLSSILDVTNTAAGVAQQINTYVLQPLAFVMSGNLLKLITASVIAFVVGKTNGTGAPQFVQNLQGNLQGVGDSKASAFFLQFGRNSNSPFAGAITSSLNNNYLQNTSSAGFFAANQNTMARYSPNPNAFMAGNWSQGGVGAWFALTTQDQNNPYTLAQAADRHLSAVVGEAEAARKEELSWGQGFLSWCGPAEGNTTASNDGTEMEGINPGDFCINKDGTPGTIKTPGASIKAAFDNASDSVRQKLVGMGSMGKEVTQILGNVATVMGTVNFATQLLGGSGQDGLFSINQTSGTNSTSRLMQYQSSPGFLGVTQGQVYQNADTLPVSGSDMLSRVADYERSWNTIRTAADAAATSLIDLRNFCTSEVNNQPRNKTLADAAQSALTAQVDPVLSQTTRAFGNIATARATVQKIQSNLNSNTEGAGSSYGDDLLSLQTMSPTVNDVVNAQQDAMSPGNASASGPNGLTVSGGSTVDRMRLLKENAVAAKSACSPQQSGGSD